jgi:FixJ family two-component response regulator
VVDSPVIGIVDDDESVRLALASLVRSAGHSIRVFSSAEDFLAAGEMRTFRCLIVDWRMPGMDGLQLQRHLVAKGFEIPIIILTAHGDDVSRAQALRAGAVAFLPKPVDAGTLLAAVDVALRYHP